MFYYFEEISKIPRGSGNTDAISEYCANFAKEHNFEYIKDEAGNVVIFKAGQNGGENAEPVILQGHLDMVCQKEEACAVNFETDGIDLYTDGDFVKARGTTLGADNGIAVAVILAILENDDYAHPPIEAVFTVDEEVGMLGALKLDMSRLRAKRMINLDSEDEGIVTVSCAGGEDFTAVLPIKRVKKTGTEVVLTVKGLKGGHSGVMINSGRVNADLLMGRILNDITVDFDIVSINGGNKPNAIPNVCSAKIVTGNADAFESEAEGCVALIKNEISAREEGFYAEILPGDTGEFEVYAGETKQKLLFALICVPNGVIEMSAEIDGLVETSLNLGILTDEGESLSICSSLRSNKKSAQRYLKKRLEKLYASAGFGYETSGYYPPWEFNEKSELQWLYSEVYRKITGKPTKTEAIHAGLECGVFSSAIDGADCISVGPQGYGAHTTEERLSISSTRDFFEVIKALLEKMK